MLSSINVFYRFIFELAFPEADVTIVWGRKIFMKEKSKNGLKLLESNHIKQTNRLIMNTPDQSMKREKIAKHSVFSVFKFL